MASYNFLVCPNPTPDLTACNDALLWTSIEVYDQSALELALITIDLEIVSAIFGGGLVLFATGIGAGMLVNIIKQARL